MSKIQCMTKCNNYTPHSNPNMTCLHAKRCVLWSDDCTCNNYEENDNEHNSRPVCETSK